MDIQIYYLVTGFSVSIYTSFNIFRLNNFSLDDETDNNPEYDKHYFIMADLSPEERLVVYYIIYVTLSFIGYLPV